MTAFTTAYPGTIKSIQRGVSNFPDGGLSTTNVTITSVSMAKTTLNYLGQKYSTSFFDGTSATNSVNKNFGTIALTSATNIQISVYSANSDAPTATVSWEAVEYN